MIVLAYTDLSPIDEHGCSRVRVLRMWVPGAKVGMWREVRCAAHGTEFYTAYDLAERGSLPCCRPEVLNVPADAVLSIVTRPRKGDHVRCARCRRMAAYHVRYHRQPDESLCPEHVPSGEGIPPPV